MIIKKIFIINTICFTNCDIFYTKKNNESNINQSINQSIDLMKKNNNELPSKPPEKQIAEKDSWLYDFGIGVLGVILFLFFIIYFPGFYVFLLTSLIISIKKRTIFHIIYLIYFILFTIYCFHKKHFYDYYLVEGIGLFLYGGGFFNKDMIIAIKIYIPILSPTLWEIISYFIEPKKNKK